MFVFFDTENSNKKIEKKSFSISYLCWKFNGIFQEVTRIKSIQTPCKLYF